VDVRGKPVEDPDIDAGAVHTEELGGPPHLINPGSLGGVDKCRAGNRQGGVDPGDFVTFEENYKGFGVGGGDDTVAVAETGGGRGRAALVKGQQCLIFGNPREEPHHHLDRR